MRAFFLLLIGFFCLQTSAQSNFTFPALLVEYDSAFIFNHVKIIPIKRKEIQKNTWADSTTSFLTLQTGIHKGLVSIHERGSYAIDNIKVLLIKNNSNKPIVIKAGELLAGGRQDRLIAKDTILLPGKQEYQLPVFCIEETRWSSREKKFTYAGSARSDLQKFIDSSQNQIKLWEEIRKILKTNNQTNSSSYASFIKQKTNNDSTNLYVQFFLNFLTNKDSRIVGFIVSTGNRILGADVFINSSLFYQMLPTLLSNYFNEVMFSGKPLFNQHQMEMKYATELFSPTTQNSFLNNRGKRLFYKGTLIQITGYSFPK
jgi:hypothetical protein